MPTGTRQATAQAKQPRLVTLEEGPAQVVERLLEGSDGPMSVAELCERSGLDAPQVRNALERLTDRQAAVRVGRGRYRFAKKTQMPSRRGWGKVRGAARDLIRAAPATRWRPEEVSDLLGINRNHACVLLSEMAQNGELVKVAPATYMLNPNGAAPRRRRGATEPKGGWQEITTLDDETPLLMRQDGTLWTARRASIES